MQLTTAEMDTYLDDRQAQGFTAILFNAIEHNFSSQSPLYRNVNGDDPFTSMTNFAAPNEDYWTHVDYFYDGIISRDMWPLMNPAYLGYLGGSQGWTSEINAESTGDLQTYGAFIGARYPHAGISLGGDYAGDATLRAKQWNVATGIRSVSTNFVFTCHAGPNELASNYWDSTTHPGFNLNWAYAYTKDGTDPHVQVAEAYAETGPIPVMFIEGQYEGEHSTSAYNLRRQTYSSILAGACGAFFGNNPIWLFDTGWEAALSSTGAAQQAYAKALFAAYSWHLLEPKTDNSFVSSSKGTSTSPVCPALASDDSFGMVYVPSSQTVTVVMSALAPSSVRARLYNPIDGTYSTVSGSPFANTIPQNIATNNVNGGECIIVLDAA